MLRSRAESPFYLLVGVGAVCSGMLFALEGNHLLGRNESRAARLLDVTDYCKLHIIAHYAAVLLGADPAGERFRVVPIAKVGDDEKGRRLLDEMRAAGIDTSLVDVSVDRRTLTSVAFIYPNGSGGNITAAVDSAAMDVGAVEVDRAMPLLVAAGSRAIALALPEVSLGARRNLLDMATRTGALRVASFTSSEIPLARKSGLLGQVDLLALNEEEASVLAGRTFDADAPEPVLERCASVIGASRRGVRAIVTAGAHGAFALADRRWTHCPAPVVSTASTAGAGDALLAGILVALAAGVPFIEPGEPQRSAIADRPLASAFDFGILLASYSVTSSHTIHPDVNLSSLVGFADGLGLKFAGALSAAISASDGG